MAYTTRVRCLISRLIVALIVFRILGSHNWYRLPRPYCHPYVSSVWSLPLQACVSGLTRHYRLAFVTLKNNLMVLALRAMIVQFVVLMLIAAFCFGGFLYALWT